MKNYFSIILLAITTTAFGESSFETSGKVAFELSLYGEDGQFSDQDYRYNASVAAEPEIYWESESGNHSLNVVPFARIDARDDERTYADIRELLWTYVNGNWDVRTGVGKVFWGVTEFNHLVDIINQTDGVESFDGEDKLGQPMLNVSRVTDWGIVDAFILPGFRERTFPGEDGRLRSPLVVDTDNARFESDDKEHHLDIALRWSHSFDIYDLGVYGFHGTDRNPLLIPEGSSLIPYYQQIEQFGVDLQATIDSWLLKWEAISQASDGDDFIASQAGFEYTLYGIAGTNADMGLLFEYGWDSRGREASSVAQNDIYLGSRITFNNSQDTALLFGGSYDQDYQSKTFLVEASTRLSDYWTVVIDAVVFNADDNNDVISFLDKDDRLQLTLERFF